MCAKPFTAVLVVSTLFEKTVGDPDLPSTGNSAHRSHQGLKSLFFKSTVFWAELLTHPLDVVIPYPPGHGICLY